APLVPPLPQAPLVPLVAGPPSDDSAETSNSTLIRRILQTLTTVKQWKIQHISREENIIADSLVKMVRDRRPGSRLFEDPPWRT
ncbi:hypothetical protein Gohar_011198, partial [Gossypium harknessii]|nr:hypothetical protein [Gossypium harknessii]